ncbi:sensor histidine kinase [Nitrosopumilus adriaticus]|uniref:histidine kinase n=1 Tax=Nitrosopumilus adriaticus TaxID=1580092 RepID=A0A0D5C3V0_9ARCH|nr:HAMP domain-containing sensor histidine kinase [Nitrosopumilus adriaticus]AJW71474.1 Histidine kinase [Nitrosopumilus adriaticus]
MNLNSKLVLIAIIPVLIATSLTSIIIAEFTSRDLFDSTISKIKSLCDLTESEMRNPMNNLDVDELNEIIDNLEKEKNILQVLVLFPDGRLFTDGTDDDYNFGKVIEDEFIQTSILEDKEMLLVEDDVIYASKPIMLNEKIGILVMEYSTQGINSRIQNSITSIILTAIIILGISAVIAIQLGRSISRPILDLRENIFRVSDGNLKNPHIFSNISEIDQLSKQIFEMGEKLEKYQKEMIKTERLAAIGELSSRITHDLRNPLNSLKMAIDILKSKKPEMIKENQEYFDMMQHSVERMNHQIDEVLGFIKKHPPKRENVKFSEIISNSLKSFQFPKNIKISVSENDGILWCDKNQIQNVIVNLISNSIHAIGKKEGKIIINFQEEQKFDKITVEDNGEGIPDDSLEAIFEPLFTTKQTGTGLGLVSCKNTVEAHNGEISAKNLPTGVIFTILLPKADVK